jgi:hypothetical protein
VRRRKLCPRDIALLRPAMQVPSGAQHLLHPSARTFLKLLREGRHTASGLIARHSFDSPQGKEQVCQTYEGLVVGDRVHPIIKSIQVETAQEYASRAYTVEHAPALFTRRVQDDNDRRARFDSRPKFTHRF